MSEESPPPPDPDEPNPVVILAFLGVGVLAIMLAAVGVLVFWDGPGAGSSSTQEPPKEELGVTPEQRKKLSRWAYRVFGPLPVEATSEDNPATAEKVRLGQTLFHDPRLSPDGKVSCNTCHDLSRGGTTEEPLARARNAPTVLNAAHQDLLYWDGRASSVEDLVRTHLVEGSSEEQVVQALKTVPGYAELFNSAYGEGEITFEHAALALAAFLRKLTTRGRFDTFMERAQLEHLTALEVKGLDVFKQVGCVSCHISPVVGGERVQKLGLRETFESKDLGRFEVTGKTMDKYMFKVPQLRNVARTGPWLHNGSLDSLEETVRFMAKHQLGIDLKPAAVEALVAFLEALNGELPKELAEVPDLPN